MEAGHPVVLTVVSGESEAEVVCGLLRSAGIKCAYQDNPTVYHLFYADEEAHAGSDITFFEYPNAGPGQAGDGMVHTVVWRVGSAAALEFWANRLSAEGHEVEPDGESLRFANPEGLQHELVVSQVGDEPLVAHHPEIPRELA